MTLEKFGLGMARGGGVWGTDDILAVAQYSPQIALAKALRIPFAPFVLPIQNTFADSTTSISNDQTFQSGPSTNVNGLGGEPSIVDGVLFEVDAPGLQSGNSLQYVNQFFYGINSGITAKMLVDGAPKYTVAPFFVPLRMICAMLNESWPAGWVLQPDQNIIMQFQQSIPVPVPPVTVTVGFRMWQPVDTNGQFVRMTTGEAFRRLRDVFTRQNNTDALTVLDQIESAPTNR